MKIAYLLPGCDISGGIAVVCQHANRLMSHGYDILLVSEAVNTDLSWFPNQNVPVVHIDQYPDDVDILIATGWSTSFRVAMLSAGRKCYFVQSDETRFHEKGSQWEHVTRLSYLMNYEFFTEARWIQKWLKDNFSQRAGLVPNGIDKDIYHQVEPLVPKGRKPRVLLEGAIDLPYKGMEQAFLAVSDLDIEVWCVSSFGRVKPGWHCDRFFENVPMDEMKKIYSSCDILLKLSRVEGFFGPPLEMMACGGAVIVGKVTGYDEYIVDGVNALVVDPLDISAAKDAVTRLIQNRPLYEKLVRNGKKTVDEWSWKSSIDQLELILNNPLKKKYNPEDDRDDINRSISFFYRQIMGGYCSDSNCNEVDTNNQQPLGHSAADKLCRRLKGKAWFGFFAELIYKIYLFGLSVNGYFSSIQSRCYSISRSIKSRFHRLTKK